MRLAGAARGALEDKSLAMRCTERLTHAFPWTARLRSDAALRREQGIGCGRHARGKGLRSNRRSGAPGWFSKFVPSMKNVAGEARSDGGGETTRSVESHRRAHCRAGRSQD